VTVKGDRTDWFSGSVCINKPGVQFPDLCSGESCVKERAAGRLRLPWA
jgi:hypothetical protein